MSLVLLRGSKLLVAGLEYASDLIAGGEGADEGFIAVLFLDVTEEMFTLGEGLVTAFFATCVRSLPCMRIHVVFEVDGPAELLAASWMQAVVVFRAWCFLGLALACCSGDGSASHRGVVIVVGERGWNRGCSGGIGRAILLRDGVVAVVFIGDANSLDRVQQNVLCYPLPPRTLRILRRWCRRRHRCEGWCGVGRGVSR